MSHGQPVRIAPQWTTIAMTQPQANAIRVFVADDHAIVREGLGRLIEGTDGLVLVGSAATSSEVMTRARSQCDFDVIVLDIGLPGAGGVEVLGQLRAERPEVKVLIFTMHPEDRLAVRLLKAGARGFVNKARDPIEVIEAISKVAAGGRHVPPSVGELLLHDVTAPANRHDALTDRENQVFLLLVGGKDPSDIAIELHLSPSTVSTHIRRVKDKLGARSTADLVRYAFRVGLVD